MGEKKWTRKEQTNTATSNSDSFQGMRHGDKSESGFSGNWSRSNTDNAFRAENSNDKWRPTSRDNNNNSFRDNPRDRRDVTDHQEERTWERKRISNVSQQQ